MCTAWIHFLLVELRPVFVFYTSARGLILKLAVDAMMANEMANSGVVDWNDICIRNQTIAAKRDCVKKAVSEAMWRVSYEPYLIDPDCYVSHASGYSMVGLFHLSAFGVTALFLCISLLLLACNGARDFTSGQYLVFTWDLEKKCLYKVGAFAILAYTGVAIYMAFSIAAGHVTGASVGLDPMQMLHLAWTDMALLLFSAIALLLPCAPAFNWQSSIVENTEFNRSLFNLIKQSNDSFGQDITNAIVRAHLGNPEDIQELAPDLDINRLRADRGDDSEEESDGDFRTWRE